MIHFANSGSTAGARGTAAETDRIMAGQNHNHVGQCGALTILSCHDSVRFRRLENNSSQPASQPEHSLRLWTLDLGLWTLAAFLMTLPATLRASTSSALREYKSGQYEQALKE